MSHVIEYSIALGALLFVLAIFFNAVDYNFEIRDDPDQAANYRSVKIMENLIGTTGWAGNLTDGTSDWHTLDPQQQEDRVTGIGLAAGNLTENGTVIEAGYGICLWDKIVAIGNLSYEKFRAACGVESFYQFNVTFIPVDTPATPVPANVSELNFGFNMETAYGQSVRERMITVLKFNDTSGFYDRFAVKINLVIFQGGYTNEQMVINELYYYGDVNATTRVEWVEVYNPGPMAVNLSYWQLSSTGAYDELLKRPGYGSIIPAGEYGVVCSNISAFLANYPGFVVGDVPLVEVRDGFLGRDGLGDRSGEVEMFYAFTGSSSVSYNDTHGGNGNGHSIERIDFIGDAFMTNWAESMVYGGTPGERNSVSSP